MELPAILRFLEEAERLKSVERTAWTATGRHESTAEHSWRLALFAALLAEQYPQLSLEKLLLLCLVHDLGELYTGDISAALLPDQEQKRRDEERSVQKVIALLPEAQAERLLALWREYDEASTPEARLIKALDKAETILQHSQGQNPDGFDYGFNLEYGRQLFAGDALLEQLRRLLDDRTRARMPED